MKYYENILEGIGKTPIVKLSKISNGLNVSLFVKVEYFNPGGSSKDRIAISMIEDAEKKGLIQPGATIIEATAGNTGAGLALVAAVKGYKCLFVLPDKMSEDKINLLKAYGAEVVVTRTNVPPDSPQSYNSVADRLAREIPGAFRPGQFTNPMNPEAHFSTTGPEIWNDMDGKIDIFVAGMGTGGTISGVGRFLKSKNPDIKVIGADPEGSILSGDSPKSYKVEGIGEDFIPATFNRQVIDEMIRVSDDESFAIARRLAREEGLLVGGSSGTAVAAALKYAQRLPPGKNIVVLLPDSGRNYLTKIFSDSWLKNHGFSCRQANALSAGEVLRTKDKMPLLISSNINDPVIGVVTTMENNDISQLPVLDNSGKAVGSINEESLVRVLHDGINLKRSRAADIMGAPLPQIDESTDISELYRLLLAGNGAVLITKNGLAAGVLSKMDLVNYWTIISNKENGNNL